MPFVRDPVPHSNDVTSLRSYLERTLAQLDAWSERVTDAVNELIRIQAVQGLEVRMRWDDTTDVVATPENMSDAVIKNLLEPDFKKWLDE